jgi:hypothetical protein
MKPTTQPKRPRGRPRKQKPTSAVTVQVVRSSDLTLEQWRKSEGLVSSLLALAKTPVFKTMMDVLRNESPVNLGLPKLGVQPTDRIVHQAQVEGYHLCLNNIEAMATVGPQSTTVEATFEDPDVQPPL